MLLEVWDLFEAEEWGQMLALGTISLGPPVGRLEPLGHFIL